MANLASRVGVLEQRAEVEEVEGSVMLVSAGEVREMTVEEWREWRRLHPGQDVVRVRETVEEAERGES